MRTSAPKVHFRATKDGHNTSRLIHPHQVLDRLESKVADAILRYRIRRIRHIQAPKERSPKVTASVLGKVVPRKVSIQLKHDSLAPLVRPYRGKGPLSPAMEYPVGSTAPSPRKVFPRLKDKNLDPLIRAHIARTSLPPATEYPPRITALARRKIFAHLKHDTLAPLIHKYTLDPLSPAMEYPVGSTAPSPSKVFPHLKHKNLDPLIRAHIARTSLPPATEYPPRITALARRKIFAHLKHDTLAPLIRKYMLNHLPSATEYPPGKTSIVPRKIFAQLVCDNLDPIIRTHTSENSLLPPQSESVGVVGKPRIRIAVEGRPVALPKPLEEVKVRRLISNQGTLTPEDVNRRKKISIIKGLGEDEPSPDELASWLDEVHALVSENIVSDTPSVTTTTEFPLSSPHYSPQYSARPPASSWNPTSTRQSLEFSKMSFSTWSSKAVRRHYATAAVSNN